MSVSGHHLLSSPVASLPPPQSSGSTTMSSGCTFLCVSAPPPTPPSIVSSEARIFSFDGDHPLSILDDDDDNDDFSAMVSNDIRPDLAKRPLYQLSEVEINEVDHRALHPRASMSFSSSHLDDPLGSLFEGFPNETGLPSIELPERLEGKFSSMDSHASTVSASIDGASISPINEKPKFKHRRVFINDSLRTKDTGDMAGNKVRTSKYTLLSFLPKNLFEQFRRVAYIYFLAIVILNQIPQLAVFGRTASLFPLLFVLVVTAIKDGYEDWGRHRSDIIENNRLAHVCSQGEFILKKWKRIQVGEVVKLTANAPVPCDMVLLETSDPSGIAYIQTLNLDGESNLKTRYACQETQIKKPEINSLSGCVVCDPPTRNIYEFSGYMELDGHPVSLGPKNVILRGCELKNTAWVVGVVVYAGKDTKVMMNSAGARSKRSKLESQMNSATMWLAFFLLITCLVGGLGMGLWVGKHSKVLGSLAYYHKTDMSTGKDWEFYNAFGEAVFAFLSFIIMFQVMIPISLYISMELVRLGQSRFMSRDKEMFYNGDGSETCFECRALNINEDLGQIKYVFSDKTGTLTQNKMEFYAATIDGVNYCDNVAIHHEDSHSFQDFMEIEGNHGSQSQGKRQVNVNPRLLKLLQTDDPTTNKKALQDFFLVLAICNTVVPIKVDDGDPIQKKIPKIEYQAESPDEQALVTAAAAYGFVLMERSTRHVVVAVQGELQRYEILGLHDFDSIRKRMSVVIRYPDGTVTLLLKGADTTVLSLLRKIGLLTDISPEERHIASVYSSTLAHIEQYARVGLRTLLVASREISEAEFHEWDSKFAHASTVLGNNRLSLLHKVAETVEKDLILLGATGVEDKLQDGVPETIAALRAAGMKVWVLTGDKQETAVSIGFSCNLLTHEMETISISSTTETDCRNAILSAIERQRNGLLLNSSKIYSESIQSSPLSTTAILSTPFMRSDGEKNNAPWALIIDGNSLVHALKKDMEQQLFDLATACQVVICCRVAPSQKANIVSLIKDKAQEMTLAIGDGANDVPMLQKAHVGIGLSGQEGRQAVMSSDFSMGQFRFLSKLLLVHGHWNYQRLSYMVLYNFYRNAVFVMMLFWYILQTAFSASSAIIDWNLMFYSLVYTSVPTVIVGIFDKDISQRTLLEHPPLYGAGQRDENYNSLLFWVTMLDTLWQSLVLFYVPLYTYEISTIDIWSLGSLWTIAVVILVNLHLAMDVQRWMRITHLAIWGSIGLTFGCLFVLDAIKQEAFIPHFWVIFKIVTTFSYWFDIVLIVALALLPRFFVKAVVQRVWPADIHIAREVEACRGPDNRRRLSSRVSET